MSSKPEEKSAKAGVVEVHSANCWEEADLGDKSRNDKFLRLMGASKKEHHGRFVIGDHETAKHARPKTSEKNIEEELEEQYAHSMDHRLVGGRKGHIGLGFHEEDGKLKDEEVISKEEDDDKQGGEDSAEKDGESPGEEKDGESPGEDEDETVTKEGDSGAKRKSLDESGPEHEEVKKMKFVKSSS